MCQHAAAEAERRRSLAERGAASDHAASAAVRAAAQRAQARRIARELAALGFALPGTPGRPDDPLRPGELPLPRRSPRLHGPYHQWTRKKNGKTATRILTDDQLADYRPWFDNHRRLRELIAELEALSLAIAEADPRWNR